jgi:hypothetical protein
MPVVRIDSGRNNNDQSEKEKERQLERQLPRMRIAEKNRSEKILANAMQSGATKKSVQEFSNLPRPATVKNKSYEDDLNHEPKHKDGLNHESKGNHDLNHEPKVNSQDLAGLHALEDLLHCRENPPSLSNILTMLKNTDTKMKHDQMSEAKAKQDNADWGDTLCSLDFLGGYVSASAEMPVIRAEIMEVIESLRQQVTNRNVDVGMNISNSQEGLVQLLGDSETQYSVQQDSSGHQKLVIEVSESTMRKAASSHRRTEARDATSNQINKPGDDSLPLAVQRSV